MASASARCEGLEADGDADSHAIHQSGFEGEEGEEGEKVCARAAT